MAETPVFVYLHGFVSSPQSAKAQFFAEKLRARGIEPLIPDLNEGEKGFFGLTLSRSVAQVRALLDRHGADERGAVLIGSSLGGYTAALVAHGDPRVRATLLMAPAFDLPGRWTAWLGEEQIAAWRKDRELEVDHHAWGRKEKLGFGLYIDALGHPPYPRTGCPTLVLHGVNDAEVGIGASQKYVEMTPEAQLVELPSDHGLLDVLDTIWQRSEEFLTPWLA